MEETATLTVWAIHGGLAVQAPYLQDFGVWRRLNRGLVRYPARSTQDPGSWVSLALTQLHTCTSCKE